MDQVLKKAKSSKLVQINFVKPPHLDLTDEYQRHGKEISGVFFRALHSASLIVEKEGYNLYF